MQNKILQSKEVKLIAISEHDTVNIIKWRNSDRVKSNLFNSNNITYEDHQNWLKNFVATKKCYQFIIDINGTPIGTVFLKDIDNSNFKAEFGIFIGEDKARGKGYGTIAAKLIVDFGFKQLGLNKIYLSVFYENKGAIRSYLKAGFIKEGLMHQEYYRDGCFVDVLMMAVFKKPSD